jgi:hypothetical protein
LKNVAIAVILFVTVVVVFVALQGSLLRAIFFVREIPLLHHRRRRKEFSGDTSSQSNLDILLWGCVASHLSGEWYDPAAVKYIKDIQGNIALRRWLTPKIHVTGPP